MLMLIERNDNASCPNLRFALGYITSFSVLQYLQLRETQPCLTPKLEYRTGSFLKGNTLSIARSACFGSFSNRAIFRKTGN